MIRWIFWLLIIFWLLSKLKYLFSNDEPLNNTNHTTQKNFSTNSNKKLKDDAGEYIDYEEI